MALEPVTAGLEAATEALKLANKLTPTLTEKELQEIRNVYAENIKAIEWHLAHNPDGTERVRQPES